ncbi:MAG: chromosomal replication initiator protein DnaA [Bacillota bacterium]|nr:chromosomal replication initiator protein DnaA [Bacillota bacterium]
MKELERQWDLTLEHLKQKLNPVSYEAWIEPLTPVRIEDESETLLLSIPEGFAKNYLDRYIETLEAAIREGFGRRLSASFLYPEELKAAERRKHHLETRDFTEEFYLNPKYIFGTFVIGNNNRLAHAAAVAVAERPSRAHNPLFIYGGAGLGKTHLMHAIGHYILRNNTKLKILYVSSEMFTNELIRAIRENKTLEFKQKYRNIDILLIDDIQFIEKKERTQEEFFHTFNTLYDANKQIIISSDRPPKDIATLEDRLRSRFEWGLIADIQPPDYETRVAILQKKAAMEDLPETDELLEVLNLIAEKIKYNIRELEGALNRVIAHANLTGMPITKELAKDSLRDVFASTEADITPEAIKKQVAAYFSIKKADLEGAKRTRELAYPRQIAMYLCRNLTDLSLPKIGEAFGGRDHTTVLHACDKIAGELKGNNEKLSEVMNILEEQLNDL